MFRIPPTWKESFTKYPNGFSLMEMLSDWATKANNLNSKVENKTDLHGDHKGTWQGLTPSESEEGTAALAEYAKNKVDGHTSEEEIHVPVYFDNTPDPALYDEGDVVLKEGYQFVYSQGENGNGSWVHYMDGTLVQTFTSEGVTCDITAGPIFRSESLTWSFPIQYDEPPIVQVSCGSNTRWADRAGNPTTTGVVARQFSYVSSDLETPTFQFYAIGKKAI